MCIELKTINITRMWNVNDIARDHFRFKCVWCSGRIVCFVCYKSISCNIYAIWIFLNLKPIWHQHRFDIIELEHGTMFIVHAFTVIKQNSILVLGMSSLSLLNIDVNYQITASYYVWSDFEQFQVNRTLFKIGHMVTLNCFPKVSKAYYDQRKNYFP